MQQLPASSSVPDQADGAGADALILPDSRWPLLRAAGWILIGLGIVALVVARDVRTNWVVGDIAPESARWRSPAWARSA